MAGQWNPNANTRNKTNKHSPVHVYGPSLNGIHDHVHQPLSEDSKIVTSGENNIDSIDSTQEFVSVLHNDSENSESNQVIRPSLDDVHSYVHEHEKELSLNQNKQQTAGPSLDSIHAHVHKHVNNDNQSLSQKFLMVIQPSIDFLDAQLHDGHEHIHDINRVQSNKTNGTKAADLDDFREWLSEQNKTDQYQRFLNLQKEVTIYYEKMINDKNLTDKLNRTIEEIKLFQKRPKHDL
ncbi:unnamed protein product [Didymodactylos carnosus]|uniref:Uncharacterized protein n=1 Tax=Didymodactylos carnosus TaxID=1234261 RepID=A0A814W258_9BILA|nr:unnamed protein product [Didymodactylos carnosus]CAF1195525.1 unnamed protein product [Didymodactylos carnosus]CAF3921385.1 unnamed protein product [Didymodactylos carnosus]CAF3959948.1 unnamed protein product [Didymodactylos carnosus]